MNSPLVTIGIPTYNRADGFLKEALGAALGQTYENLEIIVSDNCSSDGTEALVTGHRDKRIRYFRQEENIGAQNNFNFCVRKATGVYFLMLHDDDLIDPDFVEVCIAAAGGREDLGIIRTGTRLIDENGVVHKETENPGEGLDTTDFFLSWFRGEIAFYLCSTMFNTKRLQEIGGFISGRNLLNDVIAEVQLAARYGHGDVKAVKASFREHPNEITFTSKVASWCDDSIELLDLMCRLVPENKAEIIRKEGAVFLSKINYSFANKVDPLLKKIGAYRTVKKTFGHRPPPSLGLTRSIKRKFRRPISTHN